MESDTSRLAKRVKELEQRLDRLEGEATEAEVPRRPTTGELIQVYLDTTGQDDVIEVVRHHIQSVLDRYQYKKDRMVEDPWTLLKMILEMMRGDRDYYKGNGDNDDQ
jgi:3-phenylpropionate/cinnamic acid dioxygenase small subunit